LKIKSLILLLLLNLTSLYAKEVIKVASGEWIPLTGKNIKHQGFCSHVVSEAFKLVGYQTKYSYSPWKRALTRARNTDVDVSLCWTKTSEREKDFIYSNAIMTQKKVFFHRKDLDFKWSTIDDLKKYKIGVTAGYSYGKDVDKAIKNNSLSTQVVTADKQNFKKLLLERVDLVPIEMIVGYTLINEIFPPIQRQYFTNNNKAISKENYYLIISKKLPKKRQEKILKDFNKGIKILRDSGRYQQMLESIYKGYYK